MAPTPAASDRAFWTRKELQTRLALAVKRAQRLLDQPLPPWQDKAYLEFREKGLRPGGERMIKDRTAFLAPLVLAECAEGQGRFLTKLETVLQGLCAQPCWTIPAHDRALDSFSGRAPQVDLVAANLAADLGLTLFLLKERLSPATVQTVQKALYTRIFAPLRITFDTGKGPGHWWLKAASNWNAVCLAGVTTAALASQEDRRERARFMEAVERFTPMYLKSYQPGGYCTEGLAYWDYGFGHFVELREALLRASGGAVELYRLPGMADIARFGERILAGPAAKGRRPVPAYGDCRLDSQPDPLLQRMVALPLKGESLPLEPLRTGRLLESLLDLAGPQPLEGPAPLPGPDVQATPLRTWWPGSGVLVARPAQGRLALSAKGGGNGPHNHNDAGSYALFMDGDWICGDVGGPREYTSESFTAVRFTKFRLNSSEGHPVPVVDGTFQRDTSKWAPTVLATQFSPASDRVAFELGAGYAVSPLHLERSFQLDRQTDTVTVADHFEAPRPVAFETALTLKGTWREIAPGTLAFQDGGRTLRLALEASAPLALVAETIQDPNAEPFTRLALRLRDKATQGHIQVRFSPGP